MTRVGVGGELTLPARSGRSWTIAWGLCRFGTDERRKAPVSLADTAALRSPSLDIDRVLV